MKKIIGFGLAFAPFLALAQSANFGTTATNLTTVIGTIVNTAVPIAFAAALLFFFWGLAVFILSAGDEEKKKQGKSIMIWGVVALFVMAAIGGIIGVLRSTLGVGTEGVSGPVITKPTIN